jgi:hypothetical protein
MSHFIKHQAILLPGALLWPHPKTSEALEKVLASSPASTSQAVLFVLSLSIA